ncbi:response regulator transcription factor, partial [Mycobacterium tuberculosis]|nr:response regulator transcription factor [Mycobacterium tuberculosis]
HDLALIDLQLPGLDGAAVIAQLRAESGAKLCILAISADPDPDRAAAARAAGADLCLVKPLDAEALVTAALPA